MDERRVEVQAFTRAEKWIAVLVLVAVSALVIGYFVKERIETDRAVQQYICTFEGAESRPDC